MIDWHDIVYVWIFRKKFFLHTLHCHIQYARYALYSCADSQNISGSGIASIWISISFKGCHRRCRKIFHDLRSIFHIINRWRCRKFQHKFIDPVSFFDAVHRISENHAITNNRFSLRDLFQCDLVRLRDVLVCNKVFCHLCSRLDFLHRDRYVICFIYFYKQSLWHPFALLVLCCLYFNALVLISKIHYFSSSLNFSYCCIVSVKLIRYNKNILHSRKKELSWT